MVLAAVTREGEEMPLLQCWSTLEAPRPLLLLVPRHPQRFDAVADMAAGFGFTLQRRSAWTALPPAEALAADVWLGDSMGEMPLYYAASDVALLGGSFGRFGGQNLIEAAACGCPLVMGPHTFNFSEAAELSLAAGAAVRVADIEEGVARAVALARDPSRERMGAACARLCRCAPRRGRAHGARGADGGRVSAGLRPRPYLASRLFTASRSFGVSWPEAWRRRRLLTSTS